MKTRTPYGRDVKYLDKILLQNKGSISDITEAIGYYEKYNNMIKEAREDPNCPNPVKKCFKSVARLIKMPNYYKWAQQFMLIGENK